MTTEPKINQTEGSKKSLRAASGVRIFPNGASSLRLVRALAVETHEGWLEASRYLNMELLKEHKKLRISLAA
jgi:transposase-like protein